MHRTASVQSQLQCSTSLYVVCRSTAASVARLGAWPAIYFWCEPARSHPFVYFIYHHLTGASTSRSIAGVLGFWAGREGSQQKTAWPGSVTACSHAWPADTSIKQRCGCLQRTRTRSRLPARRRGSEIKQVGGAQQSVGRNACLPCVRQMLRHGQFSSMRHAARHLLSCQCFCAFLVPPAAPPLRRQHPTELQAFAPPAHVALPTAGQAKPINRHRCVCTGAAATNSTAVAHLSKCAAVARPSIAVIDDVTHQRLPMVMIAPATARTDPNMLLSACTSQQGNPYASTPVQAIRCCQATRRSSPSCRQLALPSSSTP